MTRRQSGILLHITSLHSEYGIGDLGPAAYEFADFLQESHQQLWQVLPLEPTTEGTGNSPYSSYSAFAGNPVLISPEFLVRDGYLDPEDISLVPEFPRDRVDYPEVYGFKNGLLRKAFASGYERALKDGLEEFCAENDWIEDFALFAALKDRYEQRSWLDWPEPIRMRRPKELARAGQELADRIREEKFRQFLFARQWSALKEYCGVRGIQLIGDIPIYVSLDSCDVWTNPDIFKLDEDKRPEVVAGVPPDYFSADGQLWGNPVYDWDALKASGYAWWIKRIREKLHRFDWIRLDHFRGFAASWEVPVTAETAKEGRWQEVPGEDFFCRAGEVLGHIPLIAEDLGYITEDVHQLRDRFGFPGMRVLLFGFGGESGPHPFVPHNFVHNCVVYTGTHDNATVREWYAREADHKEKERLNTYLGRVVDEENVHLELIRMAMMSVATMAIFPLQDLLGLGEEARMNVPSMAAGNWGWRMRAEMIAPETGLTLKEMSVIYGRNGWEREQGTEEQEEGERKREKTVRSSTCGAE
ncbi:MAG: 4-alpha-glucanotransferase [Desulfovibrionales bacterium]